MQRETTILSLGDWPIELDPTSRLIKSELDQLKVWFASQLAEHRVSLRSAIAEDVGLLRAELLNQKELLDIIQVRVQHHPNSERPSSRHAHEINEIKAKVASPEQEPESKKLAQRICLAVNDVHENMHGSVSEATSRSKPTGCCGMCPRRAEHGEHLVDLGSTEVEFVEPRERVLGRVLAKGR